MNIYVLPGGEFPGDPTANNTEMLISERTGLNNEIRLNHVLYFYEYQNSLFKMNYVTNGNISFSRATDQDVIGLIDEASPLHVSLITLKEYLGSGSTFNNFVYFAFKAESLVLTNYMMMLNLASRSRLYHYQVKLERKINDLKLASDTIEYERAVNQVSVVNQIISSSSIDDPDFELLMNYLDFTVAFTLENIVRILSILNSPQIKLFSAIFDSGTFLKVSFIRNNPNLLNAIVFSIINKNKSLFSMKTGNMTGDTFYHSNAPLIVLLRLQTIYYSRIFARLKEFGLTGTLPDLAVSDILHPDDHLNIMRFGEPKGNGEKLFRLTPTRNIHNQYFLHSWSTYRFIYDADSVVFKCAYEVCNPPTVKFTTPKSKNYPKFKSTDSNTFFYSIIDTERLGKIKRFKEEIFKGYHLSVTDFYCELFEIFVNYLKFDNVEFHQDEIKHRVLAIDFFKGLKMNSDFKDPANYTDFDAVNFFKKNVICIDPLVLPKLSIDKSFLNLRKSIEWRLNPGKKMNIGNNVLTTAVVEEDFENDDNTALILLNYLNQEGTVMAENFTKEIDHELPSLFCSKELES